MAYMQHFCKSLITVHYSRPYVAFACLTTLQYTCLYVNVCMHAYTQGGGAKTEELKLELSQLSAYAKYTKLGYMVRRNIIMVQGLTAQSTQVCMRACTCVSRLSLGVYMCL